MHNIRRYKDAPDDNWTTPITIYKCLSESACLGGENSSCTEGAYGPLCGLCRKDAGYVRSKDGCRACKVGNRNSIIFQTVKISFYVFGIPLFLFGWYYGCWSRLLASHEEDEEREDKYSVGALAAKAKIVIASCFGISQANSLVDLDVSSRCLTLLTIMDRAMDKLSSVKQQLKIILSFFQVAGNLFLKMETAWPSVVLSIWSAFQFLAMEIVSIPGYDCVFGDFTILQRLQMMTIAPVVLVFLIGCPFLVSQCGYRKSRRKVLLDRFYNSTLWLWYIIYPALCVTTLQNYPCMEVEGEPDITTIKVNLLH